MKKKILSPEELESVVEFRESGMTWLGIEKQTQIPRNIAKREYERWRSRSTINELSGVRLKLAEEHFKEHAGKLMKMADWVLGYVKTPTSPYFSQTADEIMDNLLMSNIFNDPLPDDEDYLPEYKQRWKRNNRILLEALLDHLQEKYGRDVLKEWDRAWDSCNLFFNELNTAARKIVEDIIAMNREIPGFIEKVAEPVEASRAVNIMTGNVFHSLGKVILDDELFQDIPLVQAKQDPDGESQVVSEEHTGKVVQSVVGYLRFCCFYCSPREPMAYPPLPDLSMLKNLAQELRDIESHANEVGGVNHLVELSPQAKAEWEITFHDFTQTMRLEGGIAAKIMIRVPLMVMKLALIYTIQGGRSEVSTDDIARATLLGTYLMETARLVPQLVQKTRVARIEQKIVDNLEKYSGEYLTVNRIHKLVSGRIKADELRRSLVALERLEVIDPEPQDEDDKGPPRAYRVV